VESEGTPKNCYATQTFTDLLHFGEVKQRRHLFHKVNQITGREFKNQEIKIIQKLNFVQLIRL
jgi:hypothetical protein